MTLKAGEIVLIPFPFSDKNTTKKRPVLLLSDEDHRRDIICLALTSSPQQTLAYPLKVNSLIQNELPKPSWVRLTKVYTLNSANVIGTFGELREEIFYELMQHYCHTIGCLTPEVKD